MKLFFTLSLVSLLMVGTVQAQSLKSNMKASEKILKQIGASMNDASRNQENAVNAGKMVTAFETMKAQSPDAGSFSEYQGLMDQSIAIFKELESAFKNNDNKAVLSLMQKINTAKKEGHDKFK
jgi:hypothetical protein